jgi:hypothetical protein
MYAIYVPNSLKPVMLTFIFVWECNSVKSVLNGRVEVELEMKWWGTQLPSQQSSDEAENTYNRT